MNNSIYVNSVIFFCAFVVFSFVDIQCFSVIPPQGQTIINPKATSSVSFIQQESNQQIFPSTTIQTRTNPRDYVNPSHTSQTNNQKGNVRDYVNPNYRPPINPQQNNQKVVNNVTTPISYASKVSGAVSAITRPTPTGSPPLSSNVENSEEGPTDAELRDFSEALLRRDINNAAKFITVHYQGRTTSNSKNDQAPQKLLDIQPEAYEIPTINKLKQLHNNYFLNTNENEYVTAQEKIEENDLLDAILATPIMQFTRNFLISKGKLSRDPRDFKNLLKLIWFTTYSRGGGKIGSSGFEHIFLAEIKQNEVSGMHNWVYFDQAEINKIVDYLGYMKKIDLGEKGAILKFHFTLNGIDKPVDSMFIGTSPELEIALYTTCYILRVDKICPLRLNGHNFIIRTYNFKYRGKNMIGSGFPEI